MFRNNEFAVYYIYLIKSHLMLVTTRSSVSSKALTRSFKMLHAYKNKIIQVLTQLL